MPLVLQLSKASLLAQVLDDRNNALEEGHCEFVLVGHLLLLVHESIKVIVMTAFKQHGLLLKCQVILGLVNDLLG